MKFLDIVAEVHLLLLIGVGLLAAISQDTILFSTDLWTLAVIFAGLSFSLTLFLLPVLALLLLVPRSHGACIRILSIQLFAAICFGALLNWWLDHPVFNYTVINLQEGLGFSGRFEGFLVLCGILMLFCMALAVFLSRFVDLSDRLLILSRGAALAALVLVVSGMVSSSNEGPVSATKLPRQNMILIVIDGLSTKYLDPYNPNEHTPEFKSLAERSTRYTNVRSNFTYTTGYFGSLYSGQKKFEFQDPGIPKPKNLISRLQEAGVNTRWISFHNNGIPDFKNFLYKGLRSLYLLEEWTWFPRLFEIDYNILRLESGKWRGDLRNYREKVLKDWMMAHRLNPRVHPLESRVPEEIEALQQDPRPFFAIVHFPVGPIETTGKRIRLWELETGRPTPANAFEAERKKILEQQIWTYREEDESVMKVLRGEYRQDVRIVTSSLYRFVEKFFEKGWDKNTLLIITADHGKMFSKGKYGYWYHNDEEVARVPLLVFWKGRSGLDHRLGESIDVTQTALEFFNVEKPLSQHGHSLLLPNRKQWVTTLTRGNRIKKVRYLNVYQDSKKYVINLFPGNFWIRQERFNTYFDTIEESRGFSALSELNRDISGLMADYGLDPEMIAPDMNFQGVRRNILNESH